ncbi:MAG: CBS domain-containing protein [Halapricum sp.]
MAPTTSSSAEDRPQSSPEEGDGYRRLLEGMADHALFMLDSDGRISLWPEVAHRLYGYEAAAIVGQGLDRLFADDQGTSPPLEDLLAEAKGGSQAQHVPTVDRTEDVREVARLMIGSDAKTLPVLDDDRVVGVVTGDAVLEAVRPVLDCVEQNGDAASLASYHRRFGILNVVQPAHTDWTCGKAFSDSTRPWDHTCLRIRPARLTLGRLLGS